MTLDDIAPYPNTEQEATAEAMIRYLLVQAQATWHRALAVDPDAEDAKLGDAAHLYSVASLLGVFRHLNPRAGNEVSRELWATWEDPPSIGISIWDDLKQLGIDPDQVNRIADEQAR
jgi:hypothetical protein